MKQSETQASFHLCSKFSTCTLTLLWGSKLHISLFISDSTSTGHHGWNIYRQPLWITGKTAKTTLLNWQEKKLGVIFIGALGPTMVDGIRLAQFF